MDVHETDWSRTRRIWWAQVESVRGRIVELLVTVALSICAVSLYPSGSSAATQAIVQSTTITVGLLLVALLWLAVVFGVVAPRVLIRDAREALRVLDVGTPQIELSGTFPTYHRKVDGQRSAIWCVDIANPVVGTVAKNVQVWIRSVGNLGRRSFPAHIHEVARVDWQDTDRFPLADSRDIRHGDELRYEIVSEPFEDLSETPAKLRWHSADFQTGTEGVLGLLETTLLELILDEGDPIEVVIRAVAAPPSPVVERTFFLRRKADGDTDLGLFELVDP
jgi:hypothetical protein